MYHDPAELYLAKCPEFQRVFLYPVGTYVEFAGNRNRLIWARGMLLGKVKGDNIRKGVVIKKFPVYADQILIRTKDETQGLQASLFFSKDLEQQPLHPPTILEPADPLHLMKCYSCHHSKIIIHQHTYLCLEIMAMRLSEVAVGVPVRIKGFEQDDIFLKLMEMGFIPGEQVVIHQVAPLGDPISIEVAGYHLSLRLNEAAKVFVEEF
jgi:ferrous iron transport protein A